MATDMDQLVQTVDPLYSTHKSMGPATPRCPECGSTHIRNVASFRNDTLKQCKDCKTVFV